MSGPRWGNPKSGRKRMILEMTGKNIAHKVAPKRSGFKRWCVDLIGILYKTRTPKQPQGGGAGGGPKGKPSSPMRARHQAHLTPSPHWQPAPRRTTATATRGTATVSNSEGLVGYLAALDKLAESSEDILSTVQAKVTEASALAESEHDGGSAQELADAWQQVATAVSSADEACQSGAAAAHAEYDPVVEALSSCNASAAQRYMGDS
ncbi:MAG: hypothetical protein ACOYBY_18515 [Dermatophilaceae bacterium]